jgi:hypothetical protein
MPEIRGYVKRSNFLPLAGAIGWDLATRSRACATSATQPRNAIPSEFTIDSDEVYTILDSHTVWVPDGDETRRPIYIIGAPWCEPCQQLFAGSRKVAGVAQLRWVEIDMRSDRDYKRFSSLYGDLGKASLQSVYDSHATPTALPSDDPAWALYRWNQNIVDFIWPGLRKLGAQGFPAIIYRDRNGKVRHGGDDLPLADIGIDNSPVPAPMEVVAEIKALERHRISDTIAVVGDTVTAELKLAPSVSLKPVLKLESGRRYNVHGFVRVDDIDWLALKVADGRPWAGITVPRILFGDARDFVDAENKPLQLRWASAQ